MVYIPIHLMWALLGELTLDTELRVSSLLFSAALIAGIGVALLKRRKAGWVIAVIFDGVALALGFANFALGSTQLALTQFVGGVLALGLLLHPYSRNWSSV